MPATINPDWEKFRKSSGHPTLEQLIEEQGLAFPRDPGDLAGAFWPENEPIEEFLSALREWRGHTKRDPAA